MIRPARRVAALRTGWALVALMLGLMIAPMAARAAERNLLNNGDFTHGAGTSCDGWRTDAWVMSLTATEFTWIRPVGNEPPQLEVNTLHDNDARWVQTLPLSPGWYYFSVEARTEKILPFFTGATISLLEDSIMSANLKRHQQLDQARFLFARGSERRRR